MGADTADEQLIYSGTTHKQVTIIDRRQGSVPSFPLPVFVGGYAAVDGRLRVRLYRVGASLSSIANSMNSFL